MKTLLSILFLALGFAARGAGLADGPNVKKPNIVFIFTDDQRYNTIKALGGDELITPNLDALVASGTTFTHAFNMGGWHGAVCVASRTMLLTGRSLWQTQRVERDLSGLVASGDLWVQQMKKAGYETYLTGKWHVRTDPSKIVDHVVNERPGMPNQTPQGYNRPLSTTDTLWTPWNQQFEGYWLGGRHWSEVLADDATAFLDAAARKSDPFFMYLAFNAPHDPRQSPRRCVEMYPLENIRIPANYRDLYPFKEEIGAGIKLRDEELAPFPRTEFAVKKQIQEYYASITHLDEQVGKIMAALAKTGKLEDTYVIFTSDHGLAVGHHGLMGKQNLYDHSVRVPFIIAGPGVPKGAKRAQQVYLQDVVPTTYQIAGVEKPAGVFFNSLLPLVASGAAPSHNEEIYGAYMQLQRMVRTDRHKLIVYPEAEKLLLFDLQNDPDELRDLSEDHRYRPVLTDLIARLKRQQQQLDDTLRLDRVFELYDALPGKSKGWDNLVAGNSLAKWRSVSTPGMPAEGWAINNGELTVGKGRKGGDIMTRHTYGDFELELEFRLAESANSGVKYLVNKVRNMETDKSAYLGIEYQLIDEANYKEVKIDPAGSMSTGAVYLLYAPKNKTLKPAGHWNQLRIVVKGRKAEHWLNGKKVAEYELHSEDFRGRVKDSKFKDVPDFATADHGHILIQDHGDEASYRNIRIHELK